MKRLALYDTRVDKGSLGWTKVHWGGQRFTGVDKGFTQRRTHDDSSHDEKLGVTNTEEVHRFEQCLAEFKVWRFVEFNKKTVIVFAGWWKI